MNSEGISDKNHLEVIYSFLSSVEKKHNIRILHAVEAGSRFWGFHCPQSDYDIRLIYVHNSRHYLSVVVDDLKKEIKEVRAPDEECPEIDVVGYELRKTLKLVLKNNPQIIHWLLYSEIVYHSFDMFLELMKKQVKVCIRTQFYHFFHIAIGNWKEYIRMKKMINRKKYIYIYRNLFSSIYMLHHHKKALLKKEEEEEEEEEPSALLLFPPMKFEILFKEVEGEMLLTALNGDVEKRDQIIFEMKKILERKRSTVGQWEKETPILILSEGFSDLRKYIKKNLHLIHNIERLESPKEQELTDIMCLMVNEFDGIPSCMESRERIKI